MSITTAISRIEDNMVFAPLFFPFKSCMVIAKKIPWLIPRKSMRSINSNVITNKELNCIQNYISFLRFSTEWIYSHLKIIDIVHIFWGYCSCLTSHIFHCSNLLSEMMKNLLLIVFDFLFLIPPN